jgi:hypothetical protein
MDNGCKSRILVVDYDPEINKILEIISENSHEKDKSNGLLQFTVTYRLLLAEPSEEYGKKDIGENVFLNDLPYDYKVYVFYYPGIMPNPLLEEKLRALGNDTGKNLFVNIGRRNDPNFDKIVARFGIRGYPVIVVTAVDELASLRIGDKFSTVYVQEYIKLDKHNLMESIDSTIRSVESLFSLFITGNIRDAIRQVKKDQSQATISHVKDTISRQLRSVGNFLSDKDISFSLAEGKFELRSNQSSIVNR